MLWYGVSHGHGCLWHDGWHGLRHDGCPMLRIFRIVMEGPKDTETYAYNMLTINIILPHLKNLEFVEYT